MGCVSSKQAVSVTPALDVSGGFRGGDVAEAGGAGDNSGRIRVGNGSGSRNGRGSSNRKKGSKGEFGVAVSCGGSELGESGRASSNSESLSFRLGNLHKYIEGEQVAAGWRLGSVPLPVKPFRIGQGTYSSVFRARDLDTGKIVALKKVRFDNFEPESVRFMAREILILRRLDHPNIIKLEGLITSRLSCSIYLVFEYMEHDITGLLSCPDIKFSEAQVCLFAFIDKVYSFAEMVVFRAIGE
ncbi:hypothetical protein CUMW_253850 [Citrus unshiu]|uniref:Protein kinase domain-containing protein n=1 Tax=Citrus unshiu TaxID=55188 RepID=A0A2H5QR55_CITUN|nr:hypothetical protein CUMW_253850 [Citrus unshiu]